MKKLFALVLVGLALACSSCSMFESACTKALPSLTEMNVYFDDVQVAVTRAQGIVNTISNPEIRQKAQIAIDAVTAALQSASSLNAAAVSACTEPNVAVIFANVIKAWKVLEPYLALLGGPAGSKVGTPLVVTQYGGAS